MLPKIWLKWDPPVARREQTNMTKTKRKEGREIRK